MLTSSPSGSPSCFPVTLFSLPSAARCPVQSIVSIMGLGWHPFPPLREGLGTLDPHSPGASCLPQSTLLKRKLEEHL